MAEVDRQAIEGLQDGANLLAEFAVARAYIEQDALNAAAKTLGVSLEQLVASERFWSSANYIASEQPSAGSIIADVGESRFSKYEYELLTGERPTLYPGRVLSKPHAIDLISRVLPHSTTKSRVKKVSEETRRLVAGLAAELKEHSDAQPSAEPTLEDLRQRNEPSRFGRLMKGIGRGLLAVAGAGLAGVNAYATIATVGAVSLSALGSMSLGIGALATGVYDDPDIIRQVKEKYKPKPEITPAPSPDPILSEIKIELVEDGLIVGDQFLPFGDLDEL